MFPRRRRSGSRHTRYAQRFIANHERLEDRRLLAGIDLTANVATDNVMVGPRTLAPQKPDPGGRAERIVSPTSQWLLQFDESAPTSVADLAAELDVAESAVQKLEILPNTFVVETADMAAFQAAPSVHRFWQQLPGITNYEQLIERERSKRLIPNDPRFGDQWHLRNTGQTGGLSGADANVTTAWDQYTGDGVLIGIVDDGLEYTHPELSNYVASASYDFNFNDNNPIPDSSFDSHGTGAAGVAAARFNNNRGVSGSAPEAALAGLRLIAREASDSDEAGALNYAPNQIDIYSNSWGPFDDGQTLEAPGTLTRAAIEQGIQQGRGGLGSIYTWAAGNGLQSNDNTNYDGYANLRYTIAVTAINHLGRQSFYAEPGAPILVAGYSDSPGITTTALNGGYTGNYGGTSSSTPLVSGVIALMLEANPNLSWRDVQHVLVNSASQNDANDNDWTTNGGGHLVNHKYGFGAIDAAAAVNVARNWTSVADEVSVVADRVNVNQQIPDNNTTGLNSSVNISEQIRVEWVEVEFDANHTYRGDLEIVLVSPSGTESVLATPHADPGNNYNNWRFSSARHWDEDSQGTWRLFVRDRGQQDVGNFNSWRLRLHGTQSAPVEPDITVVQHSQDLTLVSGQSSVDFGTHDEGASPVSQTFVVRNDGDRSLMIDDLRVPAGFNITNPLVGSLGAGQADTFTIQLPTGAAGAFSGNVEILSDDPDEDPFQFAISGEVVEVVGAELTFDAITGFTVFAGSRTDVAVLTSSAPGGISGFQLNFADSDLGPGQLQLSNWRGNPVWPVVADGELETPGDTYVAGATFGAPMDSPIPLGTFELLAPQQPGQYRLSLEEASGASGTGVISPSGTYRTLDFGTQIITVVDAPEPPATVTGVTWNTQADPPAIPNAGDPPATWRSQRSDIRNIEIEFSRAINLGVDDLVLTNLGLDAADADQVITLQPNHLSIDDRTATLTFARNELPDGIYRLEVLSTATDLTGLPVDGDNDGAAGGDYVFSGSSDNGFYKMLGDLNADLGVSVFDFPTLAYWFGRSTAEAPEYADLNGDGGVTIFDVTPFVGNFGARIRFGA